MKVTLLVLQDNEGHKRTILVKHWAATKDGLYFKNFDGSYTSIKNSEYMFFGSQEITVDYPIELLVY